VEGWEIEEEWVGRGRVGKGERGSGGLEKRKRGGGGGKGDQRRKRMIKCMSILT